MTKFLLLALIGVFLYVVFNRARRPRERREAAAPETMVQCAHCRVHLPLGESLRTGDQHFCCEEHRRLGQH